MISILVFCNTAQVRAEDKPFGNKSVSRFSLPDFYPVLMQDNGFSRGGKGEYRTSDMQWTVCRSENVQVVFLFFSSMYKQKSTKNRKRTQKIASDSTVKGLDKGSLVYKAN